MNRNNNLNQPHTIYDNTLWKVQSGARAVNNPSPKIALTPFCNFKTAVDEWSICDMKRYLSAKHTFQANYGFSDRRQLSRIIITSTNDACSRIQASTAYPYNGHCHFPRNWRDVNVSSAVPSAFGNDSKLRGQRGGLLWSRILPHNRSGRILSARRTTYTTNFCDSSYDHSTVNLLFCCSTNYPISSPFLLPRGSNSLVCPRIFLIILFY